MVQLRKKQKRMLKRIVIASILTIFLAICSAFDLLPVDGSIEKYVLFVCYLVPYLIIGYDNRTIMLFNSFYTIFSKGWIMRLIIRFQRRKSGVYKRST